MEASRRSLFSAIARIFRTPDLRRKIGFTLAIIALYRLGRTSPRPSSTSPTCRPASGSSAGTAGLLVARQPVLGRRAAAAVDLRARRHAVHHGDDHRAAAARGHPALRDPLQGGPGGPGAADAVHALPHDRARAAAVDDARHGRPQRPAVRHDRRSRVRAAAHQRRVVGAAAHDHHDDRRHRPHHVVRRARHRARHRQRHVAADLHLDRGGLPRRRCGRSGSRKGFEVFLLVLAVGIVVVALVVFVEQSQRRIPVQYAKRMVGRRTYGGTNTYIPIKVNMAGVVPVIFASSLLYIPALIAQFNQPQAGEDAAAWVAWITQLPHQRRPPAVHARCTSCSSSASRTSTSRSRSTRSRSPTT